MADLFGDAPRAAATALGAGGNSSQASEPRSSYHPPQPPHKKLIVKAIGPDGQPFTVIGQYARTLLALVKAGAVGVSAIEIATWAFRLSHYISVLRHRHHLEIPMLWEAHPGGRHGRYVLPSNVTILEISSI